MSIGYEPRPVPDRKAHDHDERDLRKFISEELRRISDAIREVGGILLPKLNVAPKKPRDGMIIYADGSNFAPVTGGGEGFYGRINNAWVKLSVGGSAGTFTPTIGDGTTNYTLDRAVGFWERIGRLVHVDAYCRWTGLNGAGAGGLVLKTLPFASLTTTFYQGSGAVGFFDDLDVPTTAGQVMVFLNTNETKLQFYRGADNAAAVAIPSNSSGTTGEIVVSIDYITGAA